MRLSKYEQETIISFNAGEKDAIIYTRDTAVMRQLDKLVKDFPQTFHLDGQTDVDKTYSMAKTCVTYRKPRKVSEEKREQARKMINKYNTSR